MTTSRSKRVPLVWRWRATPWAEAAVALRFRWESRHLIRQLEAIVARHRVQMTIEDMRIYQERLEIPDEAIRLWEQWAAELYPDLTGGSSPW